MAARKEALVQIVEMSSASQLFNVWRLRINNQVYAVMPAHCLVHRKSYTPNLDQRLKTLDWRVSSRYKVGTVDPMIDVAWAKTEPHNFLDPAPERRLPTITSLFFRQPYDYNGNRQVRASLVCMEGSLHLSPGSTDLFETMDVGFKGMSGALVVDPDARCEGLLLRRGKALPLATKSGFSDPLATGEGPSMDLAKQDPMQKVLHAIQRLESSQRRVERTTLKRTDMHDVLNVVTMRRSVVLPMRCIVQLVESGGEHLQCLLSKRLQTHR